MVSLKVDSVFCLQNVVGLLDFAIICLIRRACNLELLGYFRFPPPPLRIGAEINRSACGVVHDGELECRPVAIEIHRLLLEDPNGDK